jgi:SAM-dependent methyltransferase
LNAWLRYDLIFRLLQSVDDGAEILEIGAGLGALGFRLARRYDYTGLEQDPQSCAVAAKRLASLGRGRVIHGAEDTLPSNSTFDVVCAFEVLEHIEDDLAALRRWRSLLRPGGLVLLSTPAHQHRFGAADVMAGHFRRYGRDELASRLTEAGFERAAVCAYGFPLGYGLETARNLLAQRKRDSGSMGARTGATGCLFYTYSPADDY